MEKRGDKETKKQESDKEMGKDGAMGNQDNKEVIGEGGGKEKRGKSK